MSDVIFYACGHTIAQRDIKSTFEFELCGDVSPGMCPLCRDGRTTPHDTKSMTKDDLILGVINGRTTCDGWDNPKPDPLGDIRKLMEK